MVERNDVIYRVRILDDKTVNAIALPGGYIYVFRGLLEKLDSDDQLACVIAHEMGHVVCKHSVKRMQTNMLYTVLKVAAMTQKQDRNFSRGMDVAYYSALMDYSKQDELAADKLGD